MSGAPATEGKPGAFKLSFFSSIQNNSPLKSARDVVKGPTAAAKLHGAVSMKGQHSRQLPALCVPNTKAGKGNDQWSTKAGAL